MDKFNGFPKIPRLFREMIVTEKIDGTNAQICITKDGEFLVGSKNRWITPDSDNYGFAKWAYAHKKELMGLGEGCHFGEWWGQGIQRGYGLKEKRFSLFNVSRWEDERLRPSCCDVVPILYSGAFDTRVCRYLIEELRRNGSQAVAGFMKPEGIIVYHTANGNYFKATLEDDDKAKSQLTI